jgi:hypothetical protein
MVHPQDTHVIVDQSGTAVMSGSEELMREYAASARAMGCECELRTIDDPGSWDWTQQDWGD